MKLVTYLQNNQAFPGIWYNHKVYAIQQLIPNAPTSILGILQQQEQFLPLLKTIQQAIENNQYQDSITGYDVLLSPIPNPPSFRDAYAFRQHVATSRLNRGLPMIEEFDQFPVFYFSNHQAIIGEGNVYCEELHFQQMDYELEVAIVIGKKGKNITVTEADNYIAGFMILNDLSARHLQMQEMKLNLGPAKGKDFASAIGPWLVTPDELASFLVPPAQGHFGNCYNLQMNCSVNGEILSEGNLSDMHWTFAEIIERVSYGVTLYPGDIIGSGTVGTGCLLELNGTAKRANSVFEPRWIQPGDQITMNVTGLGTLKNTILLTN